MSSRDGSGRPGRTTRSSNHRRASEGGDSRQTRAGEPWDIDPAEIDRYLSGRPTREQESTGSARARRQQNRGTAGQLDQLQRQRGQASRPGSRPASAGRQQFVDPDPYDEPDDAYATYEQPGVDDDGYGYDREYLDPEPASPPRRRTSRRQVREPVYHDDDELYADDPYLTYDDDFAEPGARSRRPRQRPQVSKPNLPAMPKITVPKSISEAELANDIPSLGMIAVAVASVAIMAIVVSNRLDNLPAIIPTHVSANGVGEALRGRNALWSVPILASALSLMNIAASWFLARMDMFAARFLLGASLLVQFIAWIAVIKYLW